MSRPTKGDPPPVPAPGAAEPAPNGGEVPRDALDAARELVRSARIAYRGRPVGTAAAAADGDDLNYGECFTRDFAVSAAAGFAQGDTAMTADFLRLLSRLQARERRLDCFEPGAGLMPASFVVERDGDDEVVVADFGQRAIGSVAPVDAALWWLLILRAHGRASDDRSLAEDPEIRAGIERVLELYLAPRFEMTPALLVPDGAYAIDRRMGVYGHPLDVQVLFFAALRAARELLSAEHPLHEPLTQRLALLGHHVRSHYWLDAERLNVIYRYGVEEFGGGRTNRYNVYADTIPTWVMRWMQRGGGYFVGNLGPARMDFRFFAIGNLLAITSGLSTPSQTRVVLDTIADHRDDLWGQMPMKMVFPAVKGRQWRSTTGSDPKNAAWSYHNGGSWPWLVWLLAGAARRGDAGDVERVRSALAPAAARVHRDGWPEYYDGPFGGLLGRRARLRQTWTAAGLVAAEALLRDPDAEDPFAFDPDADLEERMAALDDRSDEDRVAP